MADYRSSTMELDKILEEARLRKSAAFGSQPAVPRGAAPARPATQRSFDDDFVLTDDSYSTRAPQQSSDYTFISDDPDDYESEYDMPAQRPKKKRTGLIVALCIVGVLLIAGVGGLTLWLTSGSHDIFADNVSLSGHSLAGKSMDEARAVAADIEKDLADRIKIDVKAGDKTFSYTKEDFSYSFNTEELLTEAKAYSEAKGIKSGEQNYEIKLMLDSSACAGMIDKIADEVKAEPKDASVSGFDPSDKPTFTYNEGQNGTSLNKEKSLAALTGFIGDGYIYGTVDAVVDVVEPKYTVKYLKENIKELSSFSTISTNNANGNENMRVSLAACNGSIIEPGATWSFNDCTGNSNLESNGYKPAGVIVQGRSETGIGGGICQSSTTIYNAAILCGMNVEERACHYYKSVYVDAGLDATIDYGNIDLKVSNPFEYQLFMKCWMDGTELNCVIYGLPNPEFDEVKISTTDPTFFDRGYRVYTSRTFYKDGKEVRTDDLPSSTYYTAPPSSGSSSSSSSSSSGSSSSSSSSSSSGSSSSSSSGGSTSSAVDPDPEPTPDPEPDPTPDPEPEPVPDPEPEPVEGE